MAEKTAKDTVDAKHETYAYCADGCGNRVGSAKSTFLQGHDQRLISDLSFRVVGGEMGAFQRALLSLILRDKVAESGEYYYEENDDIMDRINAVSAAMAVRFSSPLADKFTSAAMAKWEKAGRQTERAAQKALRIAEGKKPRVRKPKAPKDDPKDLAVTPAGTRLQNADGSPIESASTVGQEVQNLRGTTVKAKIGRWTYDAVVIGMSQAGKVTAVEYTDKKGEEKTTDRFTLVD
jgi:hypothetical protein